jgi:hypothetical protein
VVVGADYAAASRGRTRFIAGLGYARQLSKYGECCGPDPGYTYQEESLTVAFGAETDLVRGRYLTLAVDARYQPTLYHTMRHGSQPAFNPGPTEWHRDLGMASVGATSRFPLTDRFHGVLNARVPVELQVLGGMRRAYLLSLGVGW